MRHSELSLPGFVLLLGALVQTVGSGPARAEDLPVVNDVDLQPLATQIRRVVEALDILGQPLVPAEKARIDKAIDSSDPKAGVQTLQQIVDRHCLIGIDINPESRVKAAQGPAAPRLVQNGWTVFLVKIQNQAGVTAELQATSPNAEPIYRQSTSSAEPKRSIPSTDLTERWMDLAMFRDRPLKRALSGLTVEYRIIQVYSRDAGQREAKFSFKEGRSYVGDGRSHPIDFRVGDRDLGEAGSELKLPAPAPVKVRARVAALLDAQPSAEAKAIRQRPLDEKPYWDIERARIGQSRKVPVELVVNAYPVARAEIDADGAFHEVAFDVPVKKSSWIALRVLPSSHTNPVFVVVGDKPVRASRKSAEWCLKSVDQCWSRKERAIRPSEQEEASKAYDLARRAYRKIREESADD